MNEVKEPDPLVEARQLFKAENYELSKKKLQSIKNPNDNIELNIFLTEHKINPANSDIVLNALMDTLTGINIKLFKDIDSLIKKSKTQQNPIKHINHQYYYWNIIVIAQQIGKPSIASLIGTEALQYSKAFRTKTALMIIYQMLKQMIYENRLASCGYVVMKFKQIFQRAKSLTQEQQIYRAMNHIMWTKIFLRLGFLQQSVQMYMLKVGEGQQKLFQTNKTLVLPFQIYRQFLHAQIQYFKQNYSLTIKILGDIINLADELKLKAHCKEKVKMMVQNNISIIMLNMKKPVISCRLLLKTNQFFRKQCNQEIDNERFSMFQRSKENILFSILAQPKNSIKKQQYQKAYSLILKAQANKSYKFFYRKGQLCMNYYHQMLKQEEKNRSYKSIVDNSECCYYYPNDPYFQSKGKNRNPYFNQGKKFYRRYHLSEWNCNQYENKRKQTYLQNQQGCLQLKKNEFVESVNIQKDEKNKIVKNKMDMLEEPIQKGKKRKGSHMNIDKKKQDQISDDLQNKRCKSEPKQKQPIQQKKQKSPQLSQLTFQAISYFKQSLALLQQQKKVIITFTTPENDLTQRVNIKLYQDYKMFKQSILMQISYLYLCRQNWTKVLESTNQYRKFVEYQKQTNKFDENFKNKKEDQNQMYSILTYQMEAYCQLNRFNKAYEVLQDIIQQGYSETACFQAISSINENLGQTYLEQTNQYHNLLYNITILHTRDNHLAESHQHLQKILTETNLLPNKYSMKTPTSVNDLLLYYQLRTYDRSAALQVIKRNRVMAMGGVNGVYHILNVTK